MDIFLLLIFFSLVITLVFSINSFIDDMGMTLILLLFYSLFTTGVIGSILRIKGLI